MSVKDDLHTTSGSRDEFHVDIDVGLLQQVFDIDAIIASLWYSTDVEGTVILEEGTMIFDDCYYLLLKKKSFIWLNNIINNVLNIFETLF